MEVRVGLRGDRPSSVNRNLQRYEHPYIDTYRDLYVPTDMPTRMPTEMSKLDKPYQSMRELWRRNEHVSAIDGECEV